MLKLVKGCQVPFPEKLKEEYEVFSDTTIYANINADKIKQVFVKFIEMHQEPLFFVLHLPLELETQFSGSYNGADEREYFFVDNLDQQQALELLEQVSEVLIEDGLSRFGFGGHSSSDELFKDRFNMMSLTSMFLENYEGFFPELEVPRTETLVSAWDTFEEEHVGSIERYEVEGRDAFGMPDYLLEKGWQVYAPELVPND